MENLCRKTGGITLLDTYRLLTHEALEGIKLPSFLCYLHGISRTGRACNQTDFHVDKFLSVVIF